MKNVVCSGFPCLLNFYVDSDTNGIYSQMKIRIILRCCIVKTLLGCMMIGVLLWLCWLKVKQYRLRYQMGECVSLKCISRGT